MADPITLLGLLVITGAFFTWRSPKFVTKLICRDEEDLAEDLSDPLGTDVTTEDNPERRTADCHGVSLQYTVDACKKRSIVIAFTSSYRSLSSISDSFGLPRWRWVLTNENIGNAIIVQQLRGGATVLRTKQPLPSSSTATRAVVAAADVHVAFEANAEALGLVFKETSAIRVLVRLIHTDAPATTTHDIVTRARASSLVAVMDGSPKVPVLKHPYGRELHVFLTSSSGEENIQRNKNVMAYIRHVILQQLPRTDVNLGGRLAAALTEAIDDTLGSGEKVVFTPDGEFVVQRPAPHVAVAMPPPLAPGETIVDVPWKLLVEQDWTGETSDPAYVLEFAMTGLNDATAEANLRAQLAWDAGIKLERRGRAACETLSVVARGPSGQRVRAYTELQEHNIGESGAPLKVNVSPTGLVRIQFWPGQID